eukprot:181379_1
MPTNNLFARPTTAPCGPSPGFTRTTRLPTSKQSIADCGEQWFTVPTFSTPRRTRKLKLSGKSIRKLHAEKDASKTDHVALQDEYIDNLQQQIYFLELENQLMKEKGQSAGHVVDVVAATTGSPDTLESHIAGLRSRYEEMIRVYVEKISELEQSNRDLQNTSRKQQRLVDKLAERCAQSEDHAENLVVKQENFEVDLNENHIEQTQKIQELEEKSKAQQATFEDLRSKFLIQSAQELPNHYRVAARRESRKMRELSALHQKHE